MPDYIVKQGDCISSIAEKHGLFWEKLWNNPKNAKLKEKRKNPNVLHPGDVVFIPEKEEKQETGSTEQRHRFKRKGEPAMLRLRLTKESGKENNEQEQKTAAAQITDPDTYVGGDSMKEPSRRQDEPRANVPYVLDIDGKLFTGNTDQDGWIKVPIPGNALQGKLILNPSTEEEEVMTLQLGSIDPIMELSGVKQRLINLTFDPGNVSNEETPELAVALRAFQRKHNLKVTGKPDQATRDKLVEVHGC